MNPTRTALLLTLILAAGITAPDLPAQETAAGGPQPLQLSLSDCIQTAFQNNRAIRVQSYGSEIGESDLLFQRAQFDASVTTQAAYQDMSDPSLIFQGGYDFLRDPNEPDFYYIDPNTGRPVPTGLRDLGRQVTLSSDSTGEYIQSAYSDPLLGGGIWSASLRLERSTVTAQNFGFVAFASEFPEIYRSRFDLSFAQPLLRNFGKNVNQAAIVVAANDVEADKQTFRSTVQTTLLEVEDAYWTLVYARQDLEVRKEALRLAQELLKLNQIKVQVGTLPPIDITQAEAGVASREEAVIVAQAAIETAEDRLRRVVGMDPQSAEWRRPIVPTEDLTIIERQPSADDEVKTAIENRADLASARLALNSADVDLSYRRNQLKYSLDFSATYSLQGLAGDTKGITVADPLDPNFIFKHVAPDNSPWIGDTLYQVRDREYPTWGAALTLGIPIGNRAAEANYTKSRLQKERAVIAYQSYEQIVMVEVGNAVRSVLTDRKRIQAAEKNRTLQEKKVEAEQKKFENGLSTSFQVLTYQSDLAEARSAENSAKMDYRISLAALDYATGVLDKTCNVRIDSYTRP